MGQDLAQSWPHPQAEEMAGPWWHPHLQTRGRMPRQGRETLGGRGGPRRAGVQTWVTCPDVGHVLVSSGLPWKGAGRSRSRGDSKDTVPGLRPPPPGATTFHKHWGQNGGDQRVGRGTAQTTGHQGSPVHGRPHDPPLPPPPQTTLARRSSAVPGPSSQHRAVWLCWGSPGGPGNTGDLAPPVPLQAGPGRASPGSCRRAAGSTALRRLLRAAFCSRDQPVPTAPSPAAGGLRGPAQSSSVRNHKNPAPGWCGGRCRMDLETRGPGGRGGPLTDFAASGVPRCWWQVGLVSYLCQFSTLRRNKNGQAFWGSPAANHGPTFARPWVSSQALQKKEKEEEIEAPTPARLPLGQGPGPCSPRWPSRLQSSRCLLVLPVPGGRPLIWCHPVPRRRSAHDSPTSKD